MRMKPVLASFEEEEYKLKVAILKAETSSVGQVFSIAKSEKVPKHEEHTNRERNAGCNDG